MLASAVVLAWFLVNTKHEGPRNRDGIDRYGDYMDEVRLIPWPW